MNSRSDAEAPAPQTAIEQLFRLPAFGLDRQARREHLMAALQESWRYHFENCPAWARFCRRRGFDASSRFERPEDLPFLPVQAYKAFGEELVSTGADKVRTRLQSSATSGRPSTVLIDKITAKRQVQALTSVLASTLGSQRRPFLICDIDPRKGSPAALGARSAAVRGFLTLARESHYVLQEGPNGELQVDQAALEAALARLRQSGEPFVVFGFTYVLFESVMEPLLQAPAAAPVDAHLAHIGGWKKLEDRQISRERFDAAARHVFGIERERVVDFYGFTEQMGVVHPALGGADRVAPVFADVIVRDPDTHQPLPPGRPGLLQFVSPLPHSYPGFSVLTDDVGVLLEPGEEDGEGVMAAFQGTRFRVLGRAKNAEVRGCGDIMADKMVGTVQPLAFRPEVSSHDKARLMFHERMVPDLGDPAAGVEIGTLPEVPDMTALCDRLRERRAVLDDYSFEELAMLIEAASHRWSEPQAGLLALREQGLAFLQKWCRAAHLTRLGDEALRGNRGFLEGFRTQGLADRALRAYPRGLVAHWLSGNVPLLGMLALTQSILSRNANILKSASSYSSAIPLLLEAFRDLEVRAPGGRLLSGNDILQTIAVVYFSRDSHTPALAMSENADVRIAWGGREAVESIGRLPRRYDAEDVMFGPKLSFMVVGREALDDSRRTARLLRRAATDCSAFDQYACASPHVIFVEEGGSVSPRDFAQRLAGEMQKALGRIPKLPVDGEVASRIAIERLQHEFHGELWASEGTAWTVFFEQGIGESFPDPCYSRVVTVRAVPDIAETTRFVSSDIQTIGLALDPARQQDYADAAARRGAYRFPDIGRMTEFDAAWDGLYLMDRLVKWVTLGGPAI